MELDPTATVRRHACALVRAHVHGDTEGWEVLRECADLEALNYELVRLLGCVLEHHHGADVDDALDVLAGLRPAP